MKKSLIVVSALFLTGSTDYGKTEQVTVDGLKLLRDGLSIRLEALLCLPNRFCLKLSGNRVVCSTFEQRLQPFSFFSRGST